MIEPTAEDLTRNPAADYEAALMLAHLFPHAAPWAAAIRRAMAAEAALADCQKVCAFLAAQSEQLSRRAEGEHG